MRQPKIAAEIAKELGKFHKVNIPGPKEPQLWVDILKFFEKGFFFFFFLASAFRVLAISYTNPMSVLYLSLLAASTLAFEEPDKQKLFETISFEELYKEIVELRVLLFSQWSFSYCSWCVLVKVSHLLWSDDWNRNSQAYLTHLWCLLIMICSLETWC